MSEFEKSQWEDKEFAGKYRDEANFYLPFRSQFIAITKSLYAHFIMPRVRNKAAVLDLGCGDGFFMGALLNDCNPERVTLVDGSADMLEAAKKRLAQKANVSFIKKSFQELIAGDNIPGTFDFVFSSLAIHHLRFEEKQQLYTYIYNLLSPKGFFVHYDVVFSPSDKMEEWYLALWQQWIEGNADEEVCKNSSNIPSQYKANADNTPDMLGSQLHALTKIGFKDVDCYFKYGIFALFGGLK